jgi:hypothetical protein
MSHLHHGDADLHHEDGTHRTTAPTANGRQLATHEARIRIHLEAHAFARSIGHRESVCPGCGFHHTLDQRGCE